LDLIEPTVSIMKDLPQYELLSAYLDGELTAAEQAEVECLLATNPTARQLFDELHALSTTLQALPQQKLGEDLSQKVLRIAERRMLTEGEPDRPEVSPDAPVPLTRAIFQRFLTRRAVVWAGMAVAIAVMISIHDRQQQAHRANQADREVAVADLDKKPLKSKIGTAAGETVQPTTIGPAYGVPPGSSTIAPSRTTGNATALSPASSLGADKTPEKSSEKSPAKLAEKKSDEHYFAGKAGDAEENKQPVASKDQGLARYSSPLKKLAPIKARPSTESVGGMGGGAGFGGGMGIGKGIPADQFAAPKKRGAAKGGDGETNDYNFTEKYAPKKGKAEGENDVQNWSAPNEKAAGEDAFVQSGRESIRQKTNSKAGKAEELLVVHCDISPEAAKNKAFDKLLDANGIKQIPLPAGNAAPVNRRADGDHLTLASETIEISVEATPAQIKATLAGFAAQPDMFLTVSVEPLQHDTIAKERLSQFAVVDPGMTNSFKARKFFGFHETGALPSKSDKDGNQQQTNRLNKSFGDERGLDAFAELGDQAAEARNADQSRETSKSEKTPSELPVQTAKAKDAGQSVKMPGVQKAPAALSPQATEAQNADSSKAAKQADPVPATPSMPPAKEKKADRPQYKPQAGEKLDEPSPPSPEEKKSEKPRDEVGGIKPSEKPSPLQAQAEFEDVAKEKANAPEAPAKPSLPKLQADGVDRPNDLAKTEQASPNRPSSKADTDWTENSGTDYGGTAGRVQSLYSYQRSLQASPKQRVLFVLHIAGGERPPVAASEVRAQEKREAARATEPASPPATQPNPSKE
jgi:hypothetical protein